MDDLERTELVGRIYDFAEDPKAWPDLVKKLGQVIESNIDETNEDLDNTIDEVCHIAGDYYGSENDEALFQDKNPASVSADDLSQFLVPHLQRALKVSNKIAESRRNDRLNSSFLDRLPLGVVEVDAKGNVIALNEGMFEVLEETPTLNVFEGTLSAVAPNEKERFSDLIKQVAEDIDDQYDSGVAIRLSGPTAESALSVVMLPHNYTGVRNPSSPKGVMILVAIPNLQYEFHLGNLQRLYDLTRAEAQVVKALVNGKSVKDIASDLTKREDTVRKQLKSILRKTGAIGQAALIKLVVTGPALVDFKPRHAKRSSNITSLSKRQDKGKKGHNRRIRLPDGRCLGFAEYGDPVGKPVFHMHGLVGCRLQIHPDESIVEKAGIRLLVPDRPGYGLSDFKKGRTILEWAEDVVLLANHLGIDNFAVLGFSAGGIYALACGYRFPQRINRIVICSGMGTYTNLSDLKGMLPRNRMVLVLGRYAPRMLVPFMELMGKRIDRDPDKFVKETFMENTAAGDKVFLSDPTVKTFMSNGLKESARQGGRGMVYDCLLISRSWGFLPRDVRVPVDLWHGDDDQDVPLRMNNALASNLPYCTRQIIHNAGHYLLYQYWERILLSAIEDKHRPHQEVATSS